jgi:hypothetical protein
MTRVSGHRSISSGWLSCTASELSIRSTNGFEEIGMKLPVATGALIATLFATLLGSVPALGDYAAIYTGQTEQACSFGAVHRDKEAEAKQAAMAMCREGDARSACKLVESEANGTGNRCITITEPTAGMQKGRRCYSTGSGATEAAADHVATIRCQVSCKIKLALLHRGRALSRRLRRSVTDQALW